MNFEKFLNENRYILLLIVLFLIVKLYLLFILPEVSDESIYIYKTYLMTEGWNIYKDFGDNRMPGFFLMLYPFIYLYKIVASPPYVNIIYFGRMFALISSLVSIIFIFKIGKYLRNERTGLIAVILFMVSPIVLGLFSYVLLENFLATFSLIGFYFFIRGIEENSNLGKNFDKNLLVAGIFFGLATSIKQMGILIFPVVIFILVLKNITFSNIRLSIRKFLYNSSIIISGGILIGFIILSYFLIHGTLADFLYSLKTSVQETQDWMFIPKEQMVRQYILPLISANELFTLIIGFIGIIFSIFPNDKNLGIKTFGIWFVCYALVIYLFSNNYIQYYIPIIPSLVIISAYYMDNIIGFLGDYRKDYRKIFVILVFIIFSIYDSYHLMVQYQNFTENPLKKTTLLTPPLDQQINIGKYLYEHTKSDEKIFSIDPIYTLISKRQIVNHFTAGIGKQLTTEEFIIALSDDKIKYAIIDDRAILHLRNKWNGNIGNISLYIDFKLENPEDYMGDGFVIAITNKENSSLWWIHAKDWKISSNDTYVVNYDVPVKTKEWIEININMTSGFASYFGYVPEDYKFTILSNTNSRSKIKFQIDKIKIWDENRIYLDEDFINSSSLEKFTITKSKNQTDKVRGRDNISINNSYLDIESFNENYGLSTYISAGALGYILQNFEKEKDFIITARYSESRETIVSLYRKIDIESVRKIEN